MAGFLRFRCRQVFVDFRKLSKLFSQFQWASFDEMPLEKRLVKRLNDLGLTTLTEIQQKSLGAVMQGHDVIVNAETGSGKTLCYLIPIINRLLKSFPKQQAPSALVLVPNMDLGYQITKLFTTFCDPGFSACPVHRDSPLLVNPKYPVIVTTPQTLLQYNALSLSTIQTIVVDEADLIIASGGKDIWRLFKSFQTYPHMVEDNLSKTRQFILAAATIPQRGEKSILSKIVKWFPDIVHVTTSMVHQYVPSLKSEDIFLKEEEKLPQLLSHLNFLRSGVPFPGNHFDRVTGEICIPWNTNSAKSTNQSEYCKKLRALVFVNTVATAQNVFEFLNCQERTTFEVQSKTSAKYECNELSIPSYIQHHIQEASVDTWVPEKFEALNTDSVMPWRGKVGLLHKEMSLMERQEVLTKFRCSEFLVVVSTDLASRGLDLPNISHVVQLDFARNAVDVLHRAGRTARRGFEGTVINFITEKDHDLWKAIKLSNKGPGAEGFQKIFSRSRMFSRRIKKRL